MRLETLTDSRLPQGGAGWNADGNFLLSEVTLQPTADGETEFSNVPFRSVWADFSASHYPVRYCIDGDIGTGWAVFDERLRNHTAIFELAEPLESPAAPQLMVRLAHRSPENVGAKLGRFRISFTNNLKTLRSRQFRQELNNGEEFDVSLTLAKVHAAEGNARQALDAFAEAVELATDRGGQARVIAAAAPLTGMLDKLAGQVGDNPQFQAELSRHSTRQGEVARAEAARALAHQGYEKRLAADPEDAASAGELAELLLALDDPWTILTPVEMRSTGGATLTLQNDGSILASGTNPDWDDYVLVARPALSRITAIRLEAIPDPSLPQNGPGRDSGGNFHLNELRVTSAGKPCVLREIAVSYSESDEYRWIIDGKNDESRGWGTYTRSGQQHVAVIATQVSRSPTDELKFEFNFSRAKWTQHALGRFRLLVSDDPSLIGRSAQALQTLTSPGASDPWNKLAFAYHQAGDQAGLDRLLQRRPQAVIGLGNQLAALQNWTAAAAVWSRVLTPDSKDVETLARRANAYEKLSLWDKAAADWGRVHELVSDKTQRFDNRFAIIRRAEAYDRLRLFDKALADYNSALELPNAGIDPLNWRKDHWAKRARWSEAAADYRQLWSRRDPAWFIEWGHPRERAFLNLISGDLDGYRQAVAELLTRTEKLTDPDSARYVGYVLMVAPGMIDASNRERLTSAIERDDAWGQPRLKAAIHFRCGEFQQAAELFDQNPGGIEFEFLAAMTHARLQHTDRAWQLFRQASRALQQHRDNDPGCGENVPRSQWWGNWAMQLQLQREAARVLDVQALTDLDASLSAKPRDEALRLKRARRLADLGLPDEALDDLRAIPPSDTAAPELVELRGRLLAQLGLDDEALVALNQAIEAGTDDPHVYSARGRILRDRGSREQARTDLETSLKIEATPAAAGALAEMILKTEVPGWTVLTPTELKSAGGATLTPLGNGAILSSGMHPNRDDYTLTFAGDFKNITAISLEILPHESLGGYGGRGTGGGFILSEFDVSLRDEAGGQMPVVLNEVVADYEGTEVWAMSRYVIDGQNDDKGWGTPNNAIPHRLIVKPEGSVMGNSKILRIVLRQNHFNDAHKLGLLLGCFRLSASNHPAAFDQEQRRFAALKITDPYIKLTAAYGWSGDAERAADWLRLTEAKHELSALLESGCLTDEVLDALQARHSDSYAALLPKVALSAGERGKFELARNLYERLVKLQPENELWKERADQFRTGTIAVWDFDSEPAPWGSNSDLQLVVQKGVLTARTTGGDPHMVTTASGPAGGKAVILRYRTDEPFTMEVLWGDSTGAADESRKKQFLIPAAPGEWREITLPFSCLGTLTHLRLDPNTTRDHPLEIDSIVLRQVEPP